MVKMRFNILLIVILLVVIASGCTGGKDITSTINALPEVQQYMEEHPNATLTVTYWSKEEVAKIEQEISQQCDESITPVAMYKATIIDSDLRIVFWINAENLILICSIIEGKNTQEPTLLIQTPTPTSKKSNMGQPEIAANITYIGTKYINCNINPDYPFKTNKELIIISGIVEERMGTETLPWRAALVEEKYLFNPVTGDLISNFDELIGKVVTIKGYSGIGQITMYTPYIPEQTTTTAYFNNSFYVSEIIGWRTICCDATLEDTGIVNTPNVCFWFEK